MFGKKPSIRQDYFFAELIAQDLREPSQGPFSHSERSEEFQDNAGLPSFSGKAPGVGVCCIRRVKADQALS
jgi:hypothetical protein